MDDVSLGTRTLQPRRQLLADGKRVPLGRRALDIISVLAEAEGGIVTKDELFEKVWPGVIVEENALQVHVVALRKALGPEADRLETIRGVGYRLARDCHALNSLVDAAPDVQPAAEASAPRPASASGAKSSMAPPLLGSFVEITRRHRHIALASSILLILAIVGWGVDANGIWRSHAGESIPLLVQTFTSHGSDDPTESELASGLSDQLIDRLREVPGLRIGRGAIATSPRSGVFADAYVVDGNVRRDGDQLQVTAHLSKHDGEIVWSHSYDRKMSDVFAMQEDIARSVAGVLSVSLDVGADSTKYGGTNNADAYAAYLQFGAHQLDPDQNVPLGYLNRALQLDPHYVKALGALSTSYGVRSVGVEDPKEVENLLGKMDASSRQAIALAPNLWVGYEARAWYYVHRGDLVAAQRSFEKALKLNNANDLEPIGNYIAFQVQTGRLSAADSTQAAAGLLDPGARSGDADVWVALFRGRYQETIDRFEKLDSQRQASPALVIYAVWAHLLLHGEADAAAFGRQHGLDIEAAARAYKSNPQLESMTPAELTAWAKNASPDLGVSVGNFALWAAYYHQPQLALALLKASNVHGIIMWFPQMAEMRKLDGFKQLVRSDGLVDLWRTTGDWGDFCKPTTGGDFTCH